MRDMKYCPACQSDLTEAQNSEQPTRLVCSNVACKYVFWNNPTPVVVAIVLVEGKVMLVHDVSWPPKMLGLVSGFLEAKEHPDDAIVREIKEETGLETQGLCFLGHYAFVEQNQLIMAYEAQCAGEIRLDEKELDRYKLLEPDKLKPWAFGTGPAVKDWLDQRS